MESQGKEISKLIDTIKGLSTAIATLTETIISLQATVTKQPLIVSQHLIDITETKTVDRNMNIGINESPATIPRSNRTKRDLDNLLSMLSAIDSSIQNASINDLYQLGKFDPNQTRPRPILAKFLHSINVTTILSNRNKIKRPVVIKADVTKDERKVESILLQERWKLIQQGTSRKHITIWRSEIYVGKLLHAKVIDQKLVLYRSPEEITDTNSASSTSAEAEMEHAEA